MSEFAAVIELSELDGSNGFRINGAAVYDWSGSSVAAAGDVNGDGFDDLIIGARAADPNGYASGASYVVFGKAAGFGAELALSDLDGSNGFQMNGSGAFDFSGWSVASAGDVNGDGFDDLIIGARLADPNGYDSGASYVVFGKAAGFGPELELSDLDGANGFQINGETVGDYSGNSVASAGDINGDGFDDLIVGAKYAGPNGDISGASYVVYGKASGFGAVLELSDIGGSNGFRINGEASNDKSGRSVASAGDFNGDGFDDLIVGAYGADANGGYSGASYVVFGKASGFGADVELSALDGSNGFQISGEAAYDLSGTSVASAGDVNGDGFDDLIIGAPRATPGNRLYAGASHVVFGQASGFGADLELSNLDGLNGFQINGETGADNSGYSVASAGDVNGDGFDDLIVGARWAAPNGMHSGASYVVFGKASGFDAELELSDLDGYNGFKINGEATYDYNGISVSSAGDVNGDGFDDLIVGAYRADPNGVGNAGASYVIYGRAPDAAVNRIGSAADQTIRGGVFGDILSGLGGDDRLFGGYGWDTLAGGAGDDVLVGAHGYDLASYHDAANAVTVDLSLKIAQDTGEGMDRLVSIEALTGSTFDDVLTGNLGKNALYGGAGDDTLTGGTGGDDLFGGEGADTFIFLESSLTNRSKVDKIRDLSAGDTIDISAIDADPDAPDDDAFVLVTRFSGSGGEARIVYSSRNDVSYLQLDVDGDRAADFLLRMDGDHREFEGFVW